MRLPLPEGYVFVRHGPARAVVLSQCAASLGDILAHGDVYDWARAHPERREYRGRGAAFGVPLAQCDTRVVVRRSRHGGLLAPLLGDLFIAPTRAPRELAMSLFLRQVDVPTPPVVGYVTYATAPLLRRADVLSAEVPDSVDLAEYLAGADASRREAAWRAVARLLRSLTQAGVWHPDLNARNILVLRDHASGSGDDAVRAVLLDIDRVRLVVPGDPQVAEANLARLLRSLRKRACDPRNGTPVSESEMAALSALVRAEARSGVNDPRAA